MANERKTENLVRDESGDPDWDFMERYIKVLPSRSQIGTAKA